MKNLSRALILVFCVVFLASCLDIFNYIELQGSEIQVEWKASVSKSLMDMADDGANFDGFDEYSDNEKMLALSAETQPIDNEFEQGLVLTYVTDGKQFKDNTDFIPYYDGNRLVIPFPEGEGMDMDDPSAGFTVAFLSTARYTLLLKTDRNVKAMYAEQGGQRLTVSYTELSEGLYRMQHSLLYWMSSTDPIRYIVEF